MQRIFWGTKESMLGGRGGRFCITESCKIYLPLFALSPIFIGEGEVDFAAQRATKSTSLFLVSRLEQSVSGGETLAAAGKTPCRELLGRETLADFQFLVSRREKSLFPGKRALGGEILADFHFVFFRREKRRICDAKTTSLF